MERHSFWNMRQSAGSIQQAAYVNQPIGFFQAIDTRN
jgi:hypothetical protein